jgi:hypothetical protein
MHNTNSSHRSTSLNFVKQDEIEEDFTQIEASYRAHNESGMNKVSSHKRAGRSGPPIHNGAATSCITSPIRGQFVPEQSTSEQLNPRHHKLYGVAKGLILGLYSG